MKKYELTDIRSYYDGFSYCVLHRIRALRDIPRHGVKAGDLGGWIRDESSLSQDGDAWVGGDAIVTDYCKVFGNALVTGNALLRYRSRVFGDAKVYDSAQIHDCARIFNNAEVFGNAQIQSAQIYGNAKISTARIDYCTYAFGDIQSSKDDDKYNYRYHGPKYELVNKKNLHRGIVHQIRALRDIPRHGVKAGDLGGWIQYGFNLPQDGDSWVGEGATLYDNALVIENAFVYGIDTIIDGNAIISGNAIVTNGSTICGNAQVSDKATIMNHATVSGDAQVYDNATIDGYVIVDDCARVHDWANISQHNKNCHKCKILDNAQVYSRARIYGPVWMSGNAQVCGHAVITLEHFYAELKDQVKVYGNAFIGGRISLRGKTRVHGTACFRRDIWDDIPEGNYTRAYT